MDGADRGAESTGVRGSAVAAGGAPGAYGRPFASGTGVAREPPESDPRSHDHDDDDASRGYTVTVGRALTLGGLIAAVVVALPATIPRAAGEELTSTFVLVGVVLGHRAGPLAVIENRQTGRESMYRLGDRLEGAAVVAITADRTVLRVGQEDVELRLSVSRPAVRRPARVVPPVRRPPRLVPPPASPGARTRVRTPLRFNFNR